MSIEIYNTLHEQLQQRAPWIAWEPMGYPDRPGWLRAHVLTHPDALSTARALVQERPDLAYVTLRDAWNRVVDVAVGPRT